MQRIKVKEGQAFSIDAGLASLLQPAMERLHRQLRPRLSFFSQDGDQFVVNNVVGTIRLSSQAALEVEPKTQENDEWITAVLDLIVSGDRMDFGGDRLGGRVPQPTQLLDVLATVYAERLLHAVRRDGPLQVMTRRNAVLGFIKGKLDVTQYVCSAYYRPHLFPVSFEDISIDNSFSRALAFVAKSLATVSGSSAVRSTLTDLAETLCAGRPIDLVVDPTITERQVPSQWAVYRPAWSIAVAVLSHMSLLRPIGNEHGLEVAIESWSLLEQLLTRTLKHVPSVTREEHSLEPRLQHATFLMRPIGSDGLTRSVRPDGELRHEDRTIATFEAKYSTRSSGWPDRDHVFQAIATARALKSPLAVLVYPEMFGPKWSEVQAVGSYPHHIVAVGLGLFSYRKGTGDQERAVRIANLLKRSQALIGPQCDRR